MENEKEDRLKMAMDIFYSVRNHKDHEEHFNSIILFLLDYLDWSAEDGEIK